MFVIKYFFISIFLCIICFFAGVEYSSKVLIAMNLQDRISEMCEKMNPSCGTKQSNESQEPIDDNEEISPKIENEAFLTKESVTQAIQTEMVKQNTTNNTVVENNSTQINTTSTNENTPNNGVAIVTPEIKTENTPNNGVAIVTPEIKTENTPNNGVAIVTPEIKTENTIQNNSNPQNVQPNNPNNPTNPTNPQNQGQNVVINQNTNPIAEHVNPSVKSVEAMSEAKPNNTPSTSEQEEIARQKALKEIGGAVR